MILKYGLLASAAVMATAVSASPAFAQTADNSAKDAEVQQLRSEVQALKDQLAAISAKVDAAEAADKAAAKKPVAETKWKGGPETSDATGFTFKPRGRIQVDTGSVSAPNAVISPSLGVATEFRRVYLGAEGTIPGGFGYRIEADVANSSVDLTDVWLTYKTGKTTFTLGQQKAFWGLEEMTSDLFTSFQERAAFNSAFGFERRIGLSAAYAGKDVLVQGGVFTDNAADLNSDSNNSYSVDGRIVFSPKMGNTQLHLGGSAHYREFNGLPNSARYRARPFVHTTDLRFVDTKAFASTGESSFGLEAALINGPFHATLEGHQLTSFRPGLSNPTFRGGYAEVGYFLTKGDSVGYKGGVYDRIKPVNPLGKGGMGAFQVSARYDYLDLSDENVIGGKQSAYGLSLIWVPIDYVRFIANYGHLVLTDSPILAGTANDYSIDSVGLRAQIDF
jgi:phosphate-selective porin OprO and OprP